MVTKFEDSAKQQIWQTLLSLNDCWTTLDGNPEQLVKYFHENMVAITPTNQKRLEGRTQGVAGWVGFTKVARIHRWEELEPKVDVYGNAAVVTYDFDMSYSMGGQVIDMVGRDMLFFIKEAGRWWAVADQFSSKPS